MTKRDYKGTSPHTVSHHEYQRKVLALEEKLYKAEQRVAALETAIIFVLDWGDSEDKLPWDVYDTLDALLDGGRDD